jgi:glycosyltransferase involved in cell wall biosynthesis
MFSSMEYFMIDRRVDHDELGQRMPRHRAPSSFPCRTDLGMPSVSVIIAAYNEQTRIEETIRSVLESGFPCELIVVDDGSTDTTSHLLSLYSSKVRVITHPSNRGKGAAIASGLKIASGEIVVLCDAHLRGLTRYHLFTLVLPLSLGTAREVLGVDIPAGLSMMHILSPGLILTGQRAYFRNDLLRVATEMEDLGYGLEAFLYTRFHREDKAVVLLPGLVHLLKKDTSSLSVAFATYLREAIEIMETIARNKSPLLEAMVRRRRRIATQLARPAGRKAVSR